MTRRLLEPDDLHYPTPLVVLTAEPTEAIPGICIAYDQVSGKLYIWDGASWVEVGGGTPTTYSYLLLENGDKLLLESGDKLILG